MSEADSPPANADSFRDGPRIRAHVEQALGELPLTQQDIALLTPQLAGRFLVWDGAFAAGSPFFDFNSKVTSLVEHFAAYGLTLHDYLRAAVRHPSLFYGV